MRASGSNGALPTETRRAASDKCPAGPRPMVQATATSSKPRRNKDDSPGTTLTPRIAFQPTNEFNKDLLVA